MIIDPRIENDSELRIRFSKHSDNDGVNTTSVYDICASMIPFDFNIHSGSLNCEEVFNLIIDAAIKHAKVVDRHE